MVMILNVITDLYLPSIPLPVIQHPLVFQKIIADHSAPVDGQYRAASQDHAVRCLQWRRFCDYGLYYPCRGYHKNPRFLQCLAKLTHAAGRTSRCHLRQSMGLP